MRRLKLLDLTAACGVLLVLGAAKDSPVVLDTHPCVVAVVTAADSPLQDISRLFLRLAFLGEIVFVDELIDDSEGIPEEARRSPLHLCLEVAAEDSFLEQFLSRNYLQYRRYWANRILSGEAGTPPLRCHTEESLFVCLSRSPQCIGIVCWRADRPLPKDLKIIGVDGKRPGDPGYLAN